MTSADDRRAIERFLAGLPVDEDELAQAIAAQAIDRTIVAESLVRGLEHPEAVVRLRTAQRVARMDDVSPAVMARLVVIAETDVDLRVRAAGAEALRVHGQPVPSEGDRPRVAQPAISLRFRRLVLRSTRPSVIKLETADPTIAPEAVARVTIVESGLLRVEVFGLPPSFFGTRPTVCVRREDSGEPLDVATAAQPVAIDGSVMIDVGPEAGPVAEVKGWLAAGLELVVRTA